MPPLEAFEDQMAGGWVTAPDDESSGGATVPQQPDLDYARELVGGVQTHQHAIDGLIESYADRWALQRMPVVDRTVLRIALFELLWGDDVPVPVAINEAVELAKSLSTDDSGRFINGLLGRIVDDELPKDFRA